MGNPGITEAVDDAGGSVKQTDKAAAIVVVATRHSGGIVKNVDGICGQNATAVDARIAIGSATDGSDIAVLANGHLFQHNVAN